ncbi:MAG: HDOD domain-containing protein [Cycloclasticus sp.]
MNIPNKEEFLQLLKHDLDNETLVLPTFPDVAIKAREAADNENTTAVELAKIINTDTALSARLLKVANSPLFRARNKIENIQIAITRMGNRVVRNLIMSITVEQMFKARSQVMAERFKKAWEHSIHVAAFSRVLAISSPHLDPEQAMLAGLIHDIGVLPILLEAEKHDYFIGNPRALDKIIDELHTDVGRLIVEHWDFPESLTEVVWEHENLFRDPQAEADYSDIVLVANLQTPSRENHKNNQDDWSLIPAFKKLRLDHDVDVIEIEGVPEKIEEVEEIFITA